LLNAHCRNNLHSQWEFRRACKQRWITCTHPQKEDGAATGDRAPATFELVRICTENVLSALFCQIACVPITVGEGNRCYTIVLVWLT